MAPEFEAAAQELKGKVRFAKLDTDKDEAMAARLSIMGLPTLLFLGKYEPKDEEPEEGEIRGVKENVERMGPEEDGRPVKASASKWSS